LLGSIVFALGGLFLLGIGLLMGFTALYSLLSRTPVQAQQTIFFVAFTFEAVLLFLIAFFAFQKTGQKPAADQEVSISISIWPVVIGILIAAAALLIGGQINAVEPWSWLVLPILTIPAVVLPLGILTTIGTRRLPLSTRWRSWSVLGLSMTVTPLLLFALEAFIGIILFASVVTYLALQPELATELQELSRQIMILGPQSEAAQDLLAPLLTKPGVIITALLYIAVLVPAIEELFKPLGVWLLARKLDSPAQGFTLGALSGAGYGLIETIGVSGQAGEWASLLSSRIGTGLLHITTSALMGGAIVLAWRERRYVRLMGTYLLATLLHGLWNAFAVLFTFSNLAELFEQPGWLSTIQEPILGIMSALAIILFVILMISSRNLRRTLPPPPEPILSAEPTDQAL
jgi:hypothetical protein